MLMSVLMEANPTMGGAPPMVDGPGGYKEYQENWRAGIGGIKRRAPKMVDGPIERQPCLYGQHIPGPNVGKEGRVYSYCQRCGQGLYAAAFSFPYRLEPGEVQTLRRGPSWIPMRWAITDRTTMRRDLAARLQMELQLWPEPDKPELVWPADVLPAWGQRR